MTGREAGQQVMSETRKALEAANLGLKRGLSKLDELLEATKPIAATVVHKPGKSKSAKDADSSTTDFIEIPDNQAQIKALDILLNLGDWYPNHKIEMDLTINNLSELIKNARKRSKKKS